MSNYITVYIVNLKRVCRTITILQRFRSTYRKNIKTKNAFPKDRTYITVEDIHSVSNSRPQKNKA